MSPWISRATTTPAAFAASASSPMFSMNAPSFSSSDQWPPIAVFTIREPVGRGPVDGPDPVGEAVLRRQVGVAGERDRGEPVALELRPHLVRRAVEIDVLRPSRNGRELDALVARRPRCPASASSNEYEW